MTNIKPAIGTPVRNRQHGYIYEIKDVENKSLMMFGAGGMKKIDFEAHFSFS